MRTSFIRIARIIAVVALGPWTGVQAAGIVYQCELDGVKTFTDRACGAEARPHVPADTVTNTYSAPEIAPSPPRSVKVGSRPAKAKPERDEVKRKDACARHERDLKELRSRMRAGYSAKEGERIRAQQNRIRERQRTDRCS